MVTQIIIRYLASHKRLVVPQFGAFIVKVPGEAVVFSEMMRTDDGVLRGLLCEQGMGELEAAGAVDRFVFEVRHVLQSGGEYVMPGFGVLHCGPNGTTAFAFDSYAVPKPKSQSTVVEPKVSVLPKIAPDPSVKGLRYKAERTAEGYRYGSRPRHRRGVDKLLVGAIAAAVIALATMAVVYLRDLRAQGAEELAPMEQVVLPDAAPDASMETEQTPETK